MGMAKPSIPKTAVESQVVAVSEAATIIVPTKKARSEAEGKTICALLVAALQSPGIANLAMTAEGLDQYMELVEKAADRAFKKVFPEDK